MTMTTYFRTDAPAAPALGRWAERLRAHLRRRAAFLATRNELMSLSDRSLADLGVARADIDRVARLSVARSEV